MIINKVFTVFIYDPELEAFKVEVLKPNNMASAVILERQLKRSPFEFKVKVIR